MFTAAGVPGLESKHSQVLGLRGWRIYVTNQGENSAETLTARLIRLNREMPTAIIRTRIPTTGQRAGIHEAPAMVTAERLVELLAFWNEHHREETP